MAKKSLSDLSSDELYRLAQEREEQEAAAEKEAARAQIEELRSARREMVARHRKELAAIGRRERHRPGSRHREQGQKSLHQRDQGGAGEPRRRRKQSRPDAGLSQTAGQGKLAGEIHLFAGITPTCERPPHLGGLSTAA